MKTRIFLVCLLFVSFAAKAQYDSAAQEYDSLYSEYESEYDEYDSTEYENALGASYSISDPAQLPVTQQHNSDTYSKKEFDEAKWKEIVGTTDYTEEKTDEEQQRQKTSSNVWNPAYLKILGFAIIIALAVSILYFLVRNAFTDEKLNKKTHDLDPLMSDDTHIDHIHEQDIDALLKKALAAKDFRAAVRLYYIRLLKHLNASNYILWKKDKTNRDYAVELSSTAFVQDFRKITLAYEIIWYGERTPTDHEFEDLQKNFGELHNKTTLLT